MTVVMVDESGSPLRYPGEIFRCLVGSTLHGTGIDGGEDRDEMGVCLESPYTTVGLGTFEQHVFRTKPEGARSGPGDVDCTVYSARKFLRLATKGNPSILLVFFVPEEHVFIQTPQGKSLQELAPSVISQRVRKPYLGYMQAQHDRLVGIRGGKHTQRPELEKEFGFDTKYAMHMLRLGFQGVELLTTGKLTLPIPEQPGDFLRSVRKGEVPLRDVLDEYRRLHETLFNLSHGSNLPPEPDLAVVNEWLVDNHLIQWATVNDWPVEVIG